MDEFVAGSHQMHGFEELLFVVADGWMGHVSCGCGLVFVFGFGFHGLVSFSVFLFGLIWIGFV